MTRLLSATLAAVLFSAAAEAQTPAPATQPQKPRPGVILDTPSTGRITDAPGTPTPQPPAQLPGTAAQAPDAGATIERFEAVGNTSVASDTIRVYLGVVPGEPFDPAALQRNFHNLWQTGLFDDVRLEAERGESGVIVRAVVKERPRIGAVEFRGNKELATAKITEALEKEKIDLHVGNTIEQTLVRRAVELVKRAYSENGFEGVTVDATLEPMDEASEQRVVFRITEGIKARVAGIDFTGNARFSDRRLKSQMKEVKKSSLITWIRKKNLYIPSKLDEDLERVKNFYQDHGYFDVAFGEPQVVTVGRKTRRPRVKLVVPIKEGEIHRFGEVTVSGNTVFTSEQIIGNWPFKKGDVIRRKPIATRVDAFGEAYRSRGHIYAYVNPEYVDRDNNVIDVHIQVFEGDQFRLGRLEFQGNITTKDKVLRREIFLEEGQIMNMETLKQSLYKLGQLGYFKVTDNPDFKINPDSKTVDVTVKGNEEGKNDVQFGGGYSEGGGFFVQSQFATRNFLGEGEHFSLNFQKGTRTTYFSISYADPWFMDTPNSLSIQVFNNQLKYPAAVGYESTGKGATFGYGYRLGRFDSISTIYGYQRTRVHRETTALPDPQGNIPLAEVGDYRFITSTVAPSYSYDSRDNPFDTTRGGKFFLTAAYNGGPLGGTVHSLKPTVGLTKFMRFSRRTSMSFNVEGGYIFPLDDDCANSLEEQVENNVQLCVPETERFLVGGEYSVRGFRTYTLGPRQSFGGVSQPAGGYKYHVANLEYVTRLSDPLRLVFFADAGQAYGHAETWNPSKTRYSVGAELRIFLPVFQFPLRFIYAINPSPQPLDEFEAFQFTIGNTF